MRATVHEYFSHSWTAQVLNTPPLIAPARQFVYPLPVPGEEDAMGRGAMLLEVKPAVGGMFLATCALGFREASLPSGVFACPRADDLLAVAGGYAYLVDTLEPAKCLHLPLRPVASILAAPEEGLLLLAGFHSMLAVGVDGVAWESERLSWEGVAMTEVVGGTLHGTGWHMQSDRDVPFVLDLRTGKHSGGGFGR
jgi:hypothetical protein